MMVCRLAMDSDIVH